MFSLVHIIEDINRQIGHRDFQSARPRKSQTYFTDFEEYIF